MNCPKENIFGKNRKLKSGWKVQERAIPMNSIRFNDLHLAARGRWDDILPALGVPSHALNRKAQPCPSCGGTDRFVYDNKFGKGNFICRSMDGNVSGDGFTLLVHTGVARSNYQALTLVAQYLGVTGAYNGY